MNFDEIRKIFQIVNSIHFFLSIPLFLSASYIFTIQSGVGILLVLIQEINYFRKWKIITYAQITSN